jgi:DNA repair exonuclease SbcCD ATPase subunit
MANSDVDIKEVSMLRSYNQKFGEFGDTFQVSLLQLEEKMDDLLDEMERMVSDIESQMEQVESDISYYSKAERDCYDAEQVDYHWVHYYREKKEHLQAFKVQLNQYTNEAHHHLLRAKPFINQIKERLQKFRKNLPPFFERGKLFVSRAEQQILAYKAKNVDN